MRIVLSFNKIYWDIVFCQFIICVNFTADGLYIFTRDRVMADLLVITPVDTDSSFLPYGKVSEIDAALEEELVLVSDAFPLQLL